MNLDIKGYNVNSIYVDLCRSIIKYPDYTSKPRGLEIKECINTTLTLMEPRNRVLTLKERNMSLRYLAGELAFYFAGSDKVDFISHYSKFWNNISDDGQTVNSCYGKKLFYDKNVHGLTQFDYAIDCLRADKDSRKAVAFIYGKDDSKPGSKDHPCTLSLQFIIRDNMLHLITHMRSNDVWLGVPYDIAFFTIVQEFMLLWVWETYPEVKLGPYIHNVGSMHLYERNFKDAEKVACANYIAYPRTDILPPMTKDTSYEDMNDFVSYEEILRMDMDPSIINIKDSFFKTLSEWLI